MERSGSVYCITRAATGERYVGITIDTLARRLQKHIWYCVRGKTLLGAAILADGFKGFSIEAIEVDVPIMLLPEREKHWIAKLGTLKPNGLNANRGGAGSHRYGSGADARARKLSAKTGACFNTAKRWIREGVEREKPRRYSLHGATGTPIFKRWHNLSRRGVPIDPAWHSFERFVADLGPAYRDDMRMVRRDKTRGWGPDNFALMPGWR